MKTGAAWKPSERNPQLSEMGWMGPRTVCIPRRESQATAASSSAEAIDRSSTHSKAPKNPVLAP